MKHTDRYEKIERACVAFGRFDGVHRGHQAVLRRLKALGGCSVAVSFETENKVLTTEEEKAYFFAQEGIDQMISVPEPDCPAGTFVKEVVSEKLGAEILVIGEEHEHREEICRAAEEAGIRVELVETVKDEKGTITTQRVLQAFKNAEFEKYRQLCGHPYLIMGEVVHGKALGRTVGMPTANQSVILKKRKPESGVYATISHVAGGTYRSLTNIGTRPSVDDSGVVTVESYLLDFDRDIYGEEFCLEVWRFIRPVYKFKNLEAVKEQVKKDLEQVRGSWLCD